MILAMLSASTCELTKNRHITIAKLFAIVGFVVCCTTLNTGARYFAMCIFASGVYACNSVILGWVSSTCGQTKEKVSTSTVLTFVRSRGYYMTCLTPAAPPPVV